ncbi:type II secretion system F family protein [Desulfobacula phenolica]|uniref:Type IV pilus assembly protein PilC n=1 Tax=Desulfobacula phenolica TaxID=90732 RepID=A0A1H2J0B4_9BACT|nr:type II secretion system F family protein [Desulfobacula phenolica]SDU49830.1 type IV pilus assembly protein PilC [Desulfobacula phenolica]
MPNYSYKASDAAGRIHTGLKFANNISDLRNYLKQTGHYLLGVRQGGGFALLEALKETQPGGLSRRQLIELCNNIGVMLDAGVPLVTALEEIREDAESRYVKKVLGSVLDNLNDGDTLKNAVSKRPADFSNLFVNLVGIGEETGHLSQVFLNCAEYYKRIDQLIKNVRKAMLYPFFVLCALISTTLIFLTMVFPPLFQLLEEFKVELPMVTRIVMGVSNALKLYWWLILAGLIVFAILIVVLRKYKPTRYWFDWAELHIPVLKRVFIQVHMTFFLRYLALMLTSGVDILRGLKLSGESLNNSVVMEKMADCRERITEGSTLSNAFRRIDFIPNMVLRMVSVGETSGRLPEQMEYMANIYNDELDRRLATALAMLEPVMVVTMAALALTLIMGVLLPLYNMVSTISSGIGAGGM